MKKRKVTNARQMANTRTSQAGPTSFKIPENMQMLKIEGTVKKLDILPYITKTNPYVEPDCLHYERTYFMHRQIGADRRDYVCPNRTANQRCPICEHVRTMPDGTEEEHKAIISMLPKQRQLWLAIDLEDKEKGVQLWEYSYHNFGKMLRARLDADEDEEHIYFHDPAEGSSMRILFEEDRVGEKGRPFFKAISVEFKKRKDAYPDELIESLPCLDDLLIIHTYDELEAILHHEPEGPAEVKTKKEIDADAPWVTGKPETQAVPATADAAKEAEFKDDDWD